MNDAEFIRLCSQSVERRVACDFRNAAELAREAIEARPDQESGWHTLAMVAADLGQYADALSARKRAVEILRAKEPLPPELIQYAQQCYFGYATSLLLHGKFEEAWPYWETGRLGYSWQPPLGTNYWDGTRDSESGMLVIAEGGYGDLFAFRRFLPLIADWCDPLGVCVPRSMRSFVPACVDYIFEFGDTIPSDGTWTHATSLMSLPALLQVNKAECWPEDPPPLVIPTHPVQKIGFCWRSEENKSPRRIRSLTNAEAGIVANQLLDATRVHSLSPDDKTLWSGGCGPSYEGQPAYTVYRPENMRSWLATANYISSMDFILTVDTAVAHLAGLLGVPTLCLLPLNIDWKWGIGTESTFWYGPQFKLFRNQHPVTWDTDAIVKRVLELIS